MKNSHFDIRYHRQFVANNILSHSNGVQIYQDMALLRFKGSKAEIPMLAQSISEAFTNSSGTEKLVAKLREIDSKNTDKLSYFLLGFIAVLHEYIDREPYTSEYLQVILAIVQGLQSTFVTFQKNVQDRLLKEFEVLASDQSNWESDVENTFWTIDNLMFEMEKYSDSMVTAHYRLDALLLKETEISKGITTTTHIEQYLIKTISLLKESILVTESTHCMVDSWLVQQSILDKQPIYN